MKVASIVKVLATILLLGAGFSFFQYFTNEWGTGSLITGIGSLLMAICGLLVITNKEIAEKRVGGITSASTGR